MPTPVNARFASLANRFVDVAASAAGRPSAESLRAAGFEPAADSSHLVALVVVNGQRVCFKLYRSWARDEPEREWSLLTAMSGSGVAPEPLWRSEPGATQPVVVTSWIEGEPVGAVPLSRGQVEAIGAAHRRVHGCDAGASHFLPAINSGETALARVRSWIDELPEMARQLGEPPEVLATLRAASDWISSEDAESRVQTIDRVLCRGDTHPNNYLWHEQTLRLLDFEDSGWGDPTFELADMAEHFGTRHWPETTWALLAHATHLDDRSERIAGGRAVAAIFWLGLTIRRGHRGLSTRPPTTPSEQAARVRWLLRGLD